VYRTQRNSKKELEKELKHACEALILLCAAQIAGHPYRERVLYTVLVRIHLMIVMFRWTGLAPWVFEFPFPGSLTSTFLGHPSTLNPFPPHPTPYNHKNVQGPHPPLRRPDRWSPLKNKIGGHP